MQRHSTHSKSQLSNCLFVLILLFFITLFAGCTRHAVMATGEIKNIQGPQNIPGLLKPGEPGSSVVEVENVTVPGMKETTPPPDYVVGPNDSILVVVTNAPEYSTAIMAMVPSGTSLNTLGGGSQLRGSRVDANGEIQMPMLGQVKVGGQTLPQIRSHIEKLLKQYMKEPSVVVEVVDYGSSPLYLLGQFKATGVFYMDRSYNVLQGIARGGGYDAGTANPRAARKYCLWISTNC